MCMIFAPDVNAVSQRSMTGQSRVVHIMTYIPLHNKLKEFPC